MAGKRNINRLKKTMNKNSVSDAVKKSADTAKKAASSAALSAGVKSGASAAKKAAQNAGVGSNQNYIKNSRLSSDKNQAQNKKKATSTESVMEKYQTGTVQSARGNGSAANKAQFRRSKTELTKNQKSTLKENKNKYDKGLGGVSEGVIKRYGGSVISGASDTVKDVTNYMSEVIPGGKALKAGSSAAKKLYDNTVGKADKNLSTESIEKKLEKTGARLQKSGQEEIDKAKEGRSGAAQWGIDLGTAAAEMGLDALLTRGRGTMGAMYARSYGSAKQSALDEGASEEQARKYGRAIGGLEAATEKMFAVAKPLKALFGSGVADDVMETLLSKVASKAATQTGKSAAYHGGKTLAAAITEGLEEMVSEGLDPAIANTIYANALGTPHSTSAEDVLYAGSIGAAMGGVLGGSGQVVEYGQGRRVQSVFGDDGVKKLAKAAAQVDDTAESAKGAALNEMINQGESIAAGQANELYKAVYNQEMKDLERVNLIGESAEAVMRKEKLISPFQVNEQTGETTIGSRTIKAFNEQAEAAAGAIKQIAAETDMQLPEMNAAEISKAVAAIQTGIGGVDEVNLFLLGNPEARTIYTAVTGKELPNTNQKTREMLYDEIGKNRINSARLETENFVDEVRGLVAQDMSQQYEMSGQEAFAEAFSGVNVGNASEVNDSISTFDDFYRAGRNGIAYADVLVIANPIHANVPSEIKKAAWQAGQQDSFLAADSAKGLQMKIGETARENRSKRKYGASRGRLYSDISRENRSRFTASQQGMYRMLARTFGVDIHVVDSLENGANGEYHDGVIYLSMSSDRALEYVFAHEMTHHIQDYAPQEYNQLKELVRTRWGKQGGIEEAIDTKVSQYASHGVKLKREQALDEIIADSTYEMLQDEEFIDELSKSHRNIAQAILDAIKEVLRKLRLMIAEGDRFTPAQNEALLSELDILKEFEKLWTDGLMRAAENRDAVLRSSNNYVIRLSAKEAKKDSIRSQMRANLEEINKMDPVVKIKSEGYSGMSDKQFIDHVMSDFKKRGYGVYRKDFGFISLDETYINRSLNYLNTEAEYAAFATLPYVFKKGIAIRDKEHKGRNHNTVTFAAPVEINEKPGIVGAVVMQTKGNRYKTHRILMPDGSEFVFEKVKTEVTTSGMTEDKINDEGPDITSAVGYSIPELGKNDKRFSLKESVEETKELIALHNMQVSELEKTLDLGGFPMPSIAIIKANKGHAEYGPVSVVFGKETIDPEFMRSNKVYGGDAWTPTYPTIEYKPNKKVAKRISDMYYELADEYGYDEVRPLYNYANDLEQTLNRNKGEAGIMENLSDDVRMMQVYLLASGEGKVEDVEKEIVTELSEAEIELYDHFVNTLGKDAIEAFMNVPGGITPMKHKRGWIDEHKSEVENAYEKLLKESYGFTDAETENTLNNTSNADYMKMIRGTGVYLKNGSRTVKTEIDYEATSEKIKETAGDGYSKWLRDVFGGIEEKSGIRNNADTFTRSGNRRSWEALHWENNLENVVKAMKEEENGTGFFGGSGIWGVSAKEYGSIDEIRADSNRLDRMSDEEYEAIKESLGQRFQEISISIMDKTERNQFMAIDNAMECIVDAVRSSKTKSGIMNVLKQYPQLDVTETTVNDIVELVQDIAAMPTEYFEAKPRRAIEFDEVRAIIIPDDVTQELKSNLDEKGINVIEYKSGDESDRLTKLNSIDEVKFSLPDEADVIDYANEHDTEFVDVPPIRDYEIKRKAVRNQTYGELKAQVEKLKRDKLLTKGKVLDEKTAREEVNNMIVALMSYSESYNANGKRKTNLELVRDGVHAAGKIFTALKKGDVYEAITTAEIAAEDIVSRLELINDSAFYEYKELRDYLRSTRIMISENDAGNIPDFKQFKKSNFGRIRIVSQNGIPVDTVYAELVEKWPHLFNSEASHPADQLLEMADVRESLEPYEVMLSAEETEQLIKQTAQDLLEIAGHGKAFKSWADKKKEQYDDRIKLVKARHKEAIRDVRKNERDRAERLLRGERTKWAERVNRAVERGDKKVQAEKEKAKAKEAGRKDSQARKEYMASIEKNRRWLSDRLIKPTDDKHIPEGFKSALADLLSQIDMQTQKSKKLEEKRGERARRWVEMDELNARLAEIAKEDDSGEFVYDGYVFEIMKSLAEKMDGRSVDEASTEQLHEFDILMKYIVANIRNYNKAFDENIKEGISQLSSESINKARDRQAKLKDGEYRDRSGALGTVDKLLNESMVTPRDFFERLGGGLEKAFMSMRRGMDKHVDNISHTRDFFDELFKPYRNKTAIRKRSKPGSTIEKWRDDSQAQEFEVQGGKIKLNPAQIMSLYCLSKREQALGHIFGSGIVASKIDKSSKIIKALGGKISTNGSSVMVTMEDVVKIIDTLSEEQKAMADKLQEYLNNECAEWGNEVSMKIYGYRKFTEENYFPIKSASAYLNRDFKSRQAVEQIKNFGFTKATDKNANNPIMIDDIFAVVSDHINKMSLYNAFAAPISDFTRVYNYKVRDESGLVIGSVEDEIKKAYGEKAINYIKIFMADLNNQVQTRPDGLTKFVSKSLANYKKSVIGGNLRVALQQPTAVLRAFNCISPKYFVNTHINPVKNVKDMQEHCQIAKWKAWGFSQVDMARDIDDIMMNNEWSYIDTVTMEIYGALDNVTWSTIWAAVREETKSKHKDVAVDTEEFYRICNERASEIFDKTQVVDSVFHRSQAMRNNIDTMSKMLTSFMAEPTRTFNMVRTEYALAMDLWREGEKTKAIGKMNKATSVYVLNAALVSAAAAIADALRDRAPGDDDDDRWVTNFLANFWGNINPLNMVPVVKDIWGYTDGWGTKNMAMEGWEKLVQGTMNLATNRDAESLKAFAEGLGYVTGLPLKNIMREVTSTFKAFGIDVFAAEEGAEDKAEKEKKGILDSMFGRMRIKDGGKIDKLLNRAGLNLTEEEKAEREYNERLDTIRKDIEGLSVADKQEKIWEEATKNYTTYIEAGDMAKVAECRRMLDALGGDTDKFDKSVTSKVKTALKKNIGADYDSNKMWEYRNYLTQQGMSAAKISADVVSTSETAKDFQIALCENDENAAVESLAYLINAGITYEDAYALYVNRYSSVKAGDYSTGEFAYPVTGEITSSFGYRDSPGGIGSTDHKGIDIAVASGSNVAAADGGKVTYSGWNGGYGYMVRIDHGNGRTTEYAHLEGYYVEKGQSVSKGQVIALSGSTGNSTGPHLHFAVKQSGTYVDPMIYFK